MSNNTPRFTTRREFIKTTGAFAAGTAVFAAGVVPNVHSSVDDTIKLALVGCGGRGTGAALNALYASEKTRLVAIGDAFERQVAGALAMLDDPEYAAQVDPVRSRIDVPA